jgi:hypothetical protein
LSQPSSRARARAASTSVDPMPRRRASVQQERAVVELVDRHRRIGVHRVVDLDAALDVLPSLGAPDHPDRFSFPWRFA